MRGERALRHWLMVAGVVGCLLPLALGSSALASPTAMSVGGIALATLAAALMWGVVSGRLAASVRTPVPARVRARSRAAYLQVSEPQHPDRPGHARPRAPGRQCP